MTIDSLEVHVRQFIEGELSGPALEQWFVAERVLENLLGDAEHGRLLSLDAGEQEATIWEHFRRLLGDRFPAEAMQQRGRRICESLLGGSVDPLTGLCQMRVLRHDAGSEWARLFRALASVPRPEHYALWEPTALAERLKTLELHREAIFAAARAFLATEPTRGR